ncbi:MAG: exodeoxyribonuclease VII small subunit [Saprospiraceae bacterium]
MKENTETHTYDSACAELEQIVADLQNETVSIDDLTAKVERAQALIRFCREKLRQVEDRLQNLNG